MDLYLEGCRPCLSRSVAHRRGLALSERLHSSKHSSASISKMFGGSLHRQRTLQVLNKHGEELFLSLANRAPTPRVNLTCIRPHIDEYTGSKGYSLYSEAP